jgi:hypothetical protein
MLRALLAPSPGSAPLYKTIVQPFYDSQYVELQHDRQGMRREMDMCTVITATRRFDSVHGLYVNKI